MRALQAEMDERDLISACQRGDRSAFRLLFGTYKDQVYSAALHFSGNDASARDITQEVFLKLFGTIHQFRFESAFSTWLHRVVVNTCLNQLRKERRFVPFGSWVQRLASPKAPPDGHYARDQIADAVRRAVAKLEPELRAAVILRYLEGLSYSEIAEVLDWSIGTVSSRLNRAHKRLGKTLAHFRGEQT